MKRVGLILCFLAAAFAVAFMVRRGGDDAAGRTPEAAFKAQVDALKETAAREHPDMPRSDALKQVATRQANDLLGAGDAEDRAKTAAGIFFGSYYLNTRARPAYCRARGVDLAPFVAAYDRAHGAELLRAREIFARAGADPEALVPRIQPQFVSLVEQDMKDFAAGAQAPLEDACGLFNANADAMAQAIALPPQVREALMGGG